MAILDPRGNLFGRLNVIDGLMGLVVILGVLGVFLVQSGLHVTSGQVVEGESDIHITLMIPNLKTLDAALFKVGEKTAITIRNQPRGEVVITDVQANPVQITLPGSAGKAIVAEDLAQRHSYDYTLTLQDHAKITDDGYVAEGVKVKVGLPIELEGFKYRVYGKIVDVTPLPQ